MQKSAKLIFPQEDYFKLVGIPQNISLKPSIETLYFIVNKHVTSVSYQNIHFHCKERKPVGMSLEALKERLIDKVIGGMCFESNELMYYALEHLGFNVSRVPAFTLNNVEYNPLTPSAHNVLIAEVDKRRFLIDIGFGYNAIRYPMEFAFDKTEEIEVSPYEKYKLMHSEDHYVLCMWIKDEWFQFYRFENPIKKIDDVITIENYHTLLESPLPIPIRDIALKVGKMTNEGRIGVHYEPKARPFSAFKIEIKKGKVTKTPIHDYDTLQEKVQEILGYTLPDQDLLRLSD